MQQSHNKKVHCKFIAYKTTKMIIQPRSPNLLYISLSLDRFVPHASSSAAVTKLPPIFNSYIDSMTKRELS